jgi:hypothetical protein
MDYIFSSVQNLATQKVVGEICFCVESHEVPKPRFNPNHLLTGKHGTLIFELFRSLTVQENLLVKVGAEKSPEASGSGVKMDY